MDMDYKPPDHKSNLMSILKAPVAVTSEDYYRELVEIFVIMESYCKYYL